MIRLIPLALALSAVGGAVQALPSAIAPSTTHPVSAPARVAAPAPVSAPSPTARPDAARTALTTAASHHTYRTGPVTSSPVSFTTGHPTVVSRGGVLGLQTAGSYQQWSFTGVNAYNLASVWGTNNGCGWGQWNAASLDQFLSSLPANAMVRAWFFQSDATQVVGGVSERNWAATDQMVAEADKYNVHLVLTLGNEDGTCDDNNWKTAGWYAGGYQSVPAQVGNPAGPGRTSYAQWVHDAVSRYSGKPSIAMWEPINEPQAAGCSTYPGWNCWGQTTCANEAAATNAVYSFFTAIGSEIHALDPGKLVSDGSFGNTNCGTASSADFQQVISSPGIDVVGYHDYSGAVANPWDLKPRTAEAGAMTKPTMVGESGVTGCGSAATRAQLYGQKIQAAKQDNVSAYLAWWYGGDNGTPTCDSPIDADSPAWPAILGAAGPIGVPIAG